MNDAKFTICMLSCQHQLQDDRIYWKEAVSLKKAGYHVIHIGVGSENTTQLTTEGIQLIQLARKKIVQHPLLDKLLRVITFRKDITRHLLEAAREVNAAVYHFHDLQINKIGPELKNLPHRPKVIYDIHESYGDLIRDHSPRLLKPVNYLYALYIKRWELAAAAHYDALITTEQYVFDRFKKHLPGKPCAIIYNYSYFLPEKPPAAGSPKLYDAIYSGTISELRGIYQLVEVVRHIKLHRPAVKFIVIGAFTSERLKRRVLLLISKYGLGDNLVIHEPVAFDAIGSFYRNSRIGLCVLHPVKLYTNAVFIKLFEYMAFGLPVTGSNFGTIAHYIETTGAGLTVDPLDPRAIAGAIETMLHTPDLYHKYSAAGMHAVAEKYNWQNEVPKLYFIYETLLLT